MGAVCIVTASYHGDNYLVLHCITQKFHVWKRCVMTKLISCRSDSSSQWLSGSFPARGVRTCCYRIGPCELQHPIVNPIGESMVIIMAAMLGKMPVMMCSWLPVLSGYETHSHDHCKNLMKVIVEQVVRTPIILLSARFNANKLFVTGSHFQEAWSLFLGCFPWPYLKGLLKAGQTVRKTPF